MKEPAAAFRDSLLMYCFIVLSPLGLAGAFFLKAAQGTDWWQGLLG
ncbi:MAG TPA: hypothetical protein IGR15_09050 [Synechococcus sp. M44_DOE_062]|nr:hypothetical protein [Synechococcus sp. M44_DOE_062]